MESTKPVLSISLNEEQRLAVEHPLDEQAAVIAGAGSGKTRVLMARVMYLIACGINPKKICVITFTNKAAAEVRERVYHAMGIKEGDPEPRISTIHSLALSAIRKDPKGFGLASSISTLDGYEQSQIVQDIFLKLKDQYKSNGPKLAELETLKPWNVLEKIGFHRARTIGFSRHYTKEIHEQALKAHGGYHALTDMELEVWKKFEQEKTNQSCIDFDDMIHLVVERGRTDEKWRTRLGNMFDHVLMDESQDTNPIQWAFVEMLVRPDNRNLFCVGDISQSIYAFSGASPETLFEYSKSWRGNPTHVYKLEHNFRSVPEVVKLANFIQTKMEDVVPLKMKSHRGEQGEKGSTALSRASTARDIAASISDTIYMQNQQRKGRVEYSQHAILVRSASQVRDIEGELVRMRIPYIIRGGRGLLQTEEVKDILSYLKLVVNPLDAGAFTRAIAIPKRGLATAYVDKVKAVATANYGGNMIEGAIKYGHTKTSQFLQFITGLQAQKISPHKIIAQVIRFTQYENLIKDKYNRDKDKIEQKISNINKFLEMVQLLEESTVDLTLEDCVFRLTLHDTEDKNEDEGGCVVISTIHAAKGLEWHTVFVTNIVEGSLPHRWANTQKEIDEERRLLYVAVTRAKDKLVLCIPALGQVGPNVSALRPSRFLMELGLIK